MIRDQRAQLAAAINSVAEALLPCRLASAQLGTRLTNWVFGVLSD